MIVKIKNDTKFFKNNIYIFITYNIYKDAVVTTYE